jgi:hypothetical protein
MIWELLHKAGSGLHARILAADWLPRDVPLFVIHQVVQGIVVGKLNENNGEVVQRQAADARQLPRLLGSPSCGLGEAGLEVGLGRVGGSRPQEDVLRAPLLWEPRGGNGAGGRR